MYTRVSTHFFLRTPAHTLARSLRSRARIRNPHRPSRPNPHPTPLTPRTPRGGCAPRQRDGFSGSRNGVADLPPYHPSPWLYGQSGCGHFIKSPRIIYRLAHRTAASFPPRPPQPNPHPTPLTPRTPRGVCYGQGVRWWLHVGALSAGRKVCPTSCAPLCIFTTTNAQPSAKIGCGHFIKSPRIIYRLPHRQSAERLEADTRGARGPLASPALPLVGCAQNWGAAPPPLPPCIARVFGGVCGGCAHLFV